MLNRIKRREADTKTSFYRSSQAQEKNFIALEVKMKLERQGNDTNKHDKRLH